MMGRPLVAAILLAGVTVSVLIVAWPAPARAQPTPSAVVVAQGDGVTDEDRFCDRAPWLAGRVCGAVSDVVGGGLRTVVAGSTQAVYAALVGFVVDGAGWLLNGVAGFIDSSTDPQLRSGWFEESYRDMTVVAAVGMLPFLLLALIQALLRQDARLMIDIVFARVPFAAIGTTAAVVVVDLLVRITDELSVWVGRGIGADLSAFATGVGNALLTITTPSSTAVAGLAALLGAAIVAFAAFVIWLELLLRQAAIYVAVLFLPLGFMAMVWPATIHWMRRLAEGLVAIILSKFVIVAVMALAANAIDADVVDEGFGVVISGGSMLALAALAPYVLLRLIPVFGAGLSTQLEGTFRRPTAAVGHPVTGTRVARIVRQRAAGTGGSAAGGTVGGTATTEATGATGAATVAGTAGVAVSGAKAVSGAARRVRDEADDVADRVEGSSSGGRRAGTPQTPATKRQASRGEPDDGGER